MSILDDTLNDHRLGSVLEGTCTCGEDDYTTEHLERVIWEFTSGPPTQSEIRRANNARYARERYRRLAAADLERTRALLRQMNAEQEQIAREADAIVFRSFADRADYLIDRDPWWHYRHGWAEHPFHQSDRRLTA